MTFGHPRGQTSSLMAQLSNNFQETRNKTTISIQLSARKSVQRKVIVRLSLISGGTLTLKIMRKTTRSQTTCLRLMEYLAMWNQQIWEGLKNIGEEVSLMMLKFSLD